MMMKWEENVRKVEPYVPGEQPKSSDVIKLNTNECPYPPAPGVRKLAEEFDYGRLRLYPDTEAGKLADMILVDIGQPHVTPTQNLLNTLVCAAGGRDVTDSIINGKVVMRNRQVLTLDEEKIMADAKQHMREILSRIRG